MKSSWTNGRATAKNLSANVFGLQADGHFATQISGAGCTLDQVQIHTVSWGPGWVCPPIYTHRIQAEISRSALNLTVTVTARSTATCSFTLMSNAQKASRSGTKETRLWGDTLCVMELTVQQAARGKPQTWASSPLLLRGSSSQSSRAGPHTSLSPTVGCYSGWWSGLPCHWPGSLPLQDESMLGWPPSPQTKTCLRPV